MPWELNSCLFQLAYGNICFFGVPSRRTYPQCQARAYCVAFLCSLVFHSLLFCGRGAGCAGCFLGGPQRNNVCLDFSLTELLVRFILFTLPSTSRAKVFCLYNWICQLYLPSGINSTGISCLSLTKPQCTFSFKSLKLMKGRPWWWWTLTIWKSTCQWLHLLGPFFLFLN